MIPKTRNSAIELGRARFVDSALEHFASEKQFYVIGSVVLSGR